MNDRKFSKMLQIPRVVAKERDEKFARGRDMSRQDLRKERLEAHKSKRGIKAKVASKMK